MNQLSILLFAAGLGTRMKDLVHDRPKPLVKVGGQPLIDHALALTDLPIITRRVVNLHYKGDMLRAYLANREIIFSDETALLLETGGGLQNALPLLNGSPVLTLNTDAVWSGPNPITELLDAWHNNMEALLLTIPKPCAIGHHGEGDFVIDNQGQLQRGPDQIYTGLQIIRTGCLAGIPKSNFSMNVLWDKIGARHGLYGVSYTGKWCDVGRPESIPLAESMLNNV